jgi:hypothetical protein
MKLQSILETLALLAGTGGAALAGCSSKPSSQATEVPAAPATATSPADGEECLHADGCCGGHTPGDATCGEDKATAGDGDPDSDPATGGAWSRTWTIAPGDMAEINLELGAGDAMTARFSTDGGTLKWNVHSHEGNEAIIHAQGNDASGGPRHVAAKAGMYSFLWKNEGTKPIQLEVALEEGASKVHSTHPAE